MKYNFDNLPNRRDTNSLKWDVKENELPLWVADMDFACPDFIKDALQKRLDLSVFGYSTINEEFYTSIIDWFKRRYGYEFKREWMVFSTGVVASISSLVRKLTTPAENVLVLTPVYNIFYNSIYNNGRNILMSYLREENGVFSIDFEDLENKLALSQTTLMILCNPHNPVGKIYTKEELIKIGNLCKKHGVTIISDEIHCDMLRQGRTYIPFASCNPNNEDISITLVAPSKTFNLAGLQVSCAISKNEFLRNKLIRALNTDEVAEPNFFAISASIAAYKYGEDWVNELNDYIDKNYAYACSFIKKELPKVVISPLEATYLMWIDLKNYIDDSDKFLTYLRQTTGLYISSGSQYVHNLKSTWVRINLATSLANVKDAFSRLKVGLEKYSN